jgi:hypothetical protein
MRFTGTLVRPLADQGDRDGLLIDPAGVEFVEGRDYPVTAEFDLAAPLGYAVVSRAEDGSLVAAGEIVYAEAADVKGLRLAAGAVIAAHTERILPGVRGRVVTSCRLNAIGLTPNHSDPGQPPIEVIP